MKNVTAAKGPSTRRPDLKDRLFAAALIIGICLVLLMAALITRFSELTNGD